jgi:DNA-binding NtrC family response regulator
MGFVGESARAQQLREDVFFAASGGRHVFIHGPTGTGKELVARAIHALSPRAANPYVTANSASFTAELAALELFGNPKGYPNIGTPERLGYFGQARGGTLLLDEVGEVLPAVQAPLLRVLEGVYNRVGDSVSRPTDCIVILSTNRGPASIKHDILHRLGVTVETPALAERREDIPLLVRTLLLRRADTDPAFASAFVVHDARGWRHVEVDASLIVGLLRSPLPGNVREVDNILTAAIAASAGQPALRWPPRLTLPPPPPPAIEAEPDAPGVDELVDGIRGAREPSRVELYEALQANRWHIEKTAAALGMSTDKLYRLRIKYGLREPK